MEEPRFARRATYLLLLGALASCGGGGSGSISASTSLVSATGTPGQSPVPSQSFELHVNGNTNDLYLLVENGESGIDLLLADDGTSNIIFTLYYRDPGSLANGTYNDEIVIRVCKDEDCEVQLEGSPLTVQSSYVVTGEGNSTLSATATNLHVRTNNARFAATQPRVDYSFVRPAGTFMQLYMEHTTNGIESDVSVPAVNDGYYEFRLKRGVSLAPGTYSDTITLKGCYHVSCVRQVPGSPFVFNVTYTVEARSDVVATPVPLAQRIALPHDIVDAEYSRALDSLVVAARAPANALYLRATATGVAKEQLLGAPPSAVAVSPDGMRAVVGHDGSISIVDLASIGMPGAPAPQVIPVAMSVFDLVVDNLGRVHASGRAGGADGLLAIDIATQVQHKATAGWLDSAVHLRLHADGNRLYTPDGTQFDAFDRPIVDVARWNLAGITPLLEGSRSIPRTLVEQPHAPCDNLWFDESGQRLFESCGHVFAVAQDPATDLAQAGTLNLSWALANFKLAWLDHSAVRGELAAIEFDSSGCPQPNPNIACNQHLRLHHDDTLATKAVYNIPAFAPTPGSTALAQRGMFAFFSADGSKLLLLSRLVNDAFQDAGFHYLSLVQIN